MAQSGDLTPPRPPALRWAPIHLQRGVGQVQVARVPGENTVTVARLMVHGSPQERTCPLGVWVQNALLSLLSLPNSTLA